MSQLGSRPFQKIDPGGGIYEDNGASAMNKNMKTNQENSDQFVNNTIQLLDYLSSLIINSNSTESVGSLFVPSNPPTISEVGNNDQRRQTTVKPFLYKPTSTIISRPSSNFLKGPQHAMSYETNPGNAAQTNKLPSVSSSSSTITHLDSLLRNLERLENINRDMSLESPLSQNGRAQKYKSSAGSEYSTVGKDLKEFQELLNLRQTLDNFYDTKVNKRTKSNLEDSLIQQMNQGNRGQSQNHHE